MLGSFQFALYERLARIFAKQRFSNCGVYVFIAVAVAGWGYIALRQ